MFRNLPKYLQTEICSYLDKGDVRNVMHTSKGAYSLFSIDSPFWLKRIKQEFKLDYQDIASDKSLANKSKKDIYLHLLEEKKRVIQYATLLFFHFMQTEYVHHQGGYDLIRGCPVLDKILERASLDQELSSYINVNSKTGAKQYYQTLINNTNKPRKKTFFEKLINEIIELPEVNTLTEKTFIDDLTKKIIEPLFNEFLFGGINPFDQIDDQYNPLDCLNEKDFHLKDHGKAFPVLNVVNKDYSSAKDLFLDHQYLLFMFYFKALAATNASTLMHALLKNTPLVKHPHATSLVFLHAFMEPHVEVIEKLLQFKINLNQCGWYKSGYFIAYGSPVSLFTVNECINTAKLIATKKIDEGRLEQYKTILRMLFQHDVNISTPFYMYEDSGMDNEWVRQVLQSNLYPTFLTYITSMVDPLALNRAQEENPFHVENNEYKEGVNVLSRIITALKSILQEANVTYEDLSTYTNRVSTIKNNPKN